MNRGDPHNEIASKGSGPDPMIPFPFEPYVVQKQLMLKIYNTLERGGVGIFESPTGTGKSLSVICSALQWLKDAEARDVDAETAPDEGAKSAHGNKENGGNNGENTDASRQTKEGGDGTNLAGARASSWLDAYSKAKEQQEREESAGELEARLAAVREEQRISDLGRKSSTSGRRKDAFLGGAREGLGARGLGRSRSGGSEGTGRKRPLPPLKKSSSPAEKPNSGDDPEEEFLVAEYNSGSEAGSRRGLGDSSDEEDNDGGSGSRKWGGGDVDKWEDLGLRQILYCSRTHSQTSQFVNEVKKTAFAEGVRCASLGSRRTLCGNEAVSSLRSDAKMTDACLELQKSKNKKEKEKEKEKGKGKKDSIEGSKGNKKGRSNGSTGSVSRYPSSGHGDGDGAGDTKRGMDENEEETRDSCPLLSSEGQREFPYRALTSVRDIEELAKLGKRDGTCAYYGARKAAALAQLVVMPYAALLSQETRAALGVRLSGAVVIVDEAHNIVEAINSVHSKRLTLSEVSRAHSQLSQYEAKYGSRLKGRNAFYVGNILRLLRSVLKFLKNGKKNLDQLRAKTAATAACKTFPQAPGCTAARVQGHSSHCPRIPCGVAKNNGRGLGAPGEGVREVTEQEAEEDARSEMLEVNDFLFRAGVDNVNIFKLRGYMRKSEISRKVMGFMDLSEALLPEVTVRTKPLAGGGGESGGDQGRQGAGEAREARDTFVSKNISALQNVEGFLDALTNSTRDGRVLVTYGGKPSLGQKKQQQQPHQGDEEPSVKFLMLNPSVHFDEIVQKARAVVLVGGTMQPTSDLVRQLFSSIEPSRVDVFSCGHVIPRENLLPLCVSRGPSGKTFNFTFHRRGSDEQIDELGRLMVNACKLVPGGVVCFVASYGYLDQVLQRWKASGSLRQLAKLKSIFSEPRSAKDVDAVLRDFSLAARAGAHNPSKGSGVGGGGGALLMSVVGAKMSEGINFSDDLARCVVMVGLPYPDKRDPELKQKMAYLDRADPSSHGRAGREYYSNICMRAVNQSIGRSIRHAGDYASILLVDERYHDDQVVRLLPGWIAERVVKPPNFGGSFVALRKFFAEMHARQAS